MLRLNDVAPDFTADSTQGQIRFHDWIGDGWCVLFSHPKDFTPVCTSELEHMAMLQDAFARRNVKVIGLSVDPVESHERWKQDIPDVSGRLVDYPLIGDPTLAVAKLYGMLPGESSDTSEGRTAADNVTARAVFVIGPDKRIKLSLTYPMITGRNFDELLRVIDSLQLTAKHHVATPANWVRGEDVIIVPSVPDEAARAKSPQGRRAPKPYMRVVKQPV